MTDERIRLVTMPKWGLSMTTGEITDWWVTEGEEVTEGADLADIDTDKIAGPLEAEGPGTLRRIVVGKGSRAPVGAVLAVQAPAEVPDSEIDTVVAEAQQRNAELAEAVESGAEDTGPAAQTVTVGRRALSYLSVGEAGSDGVATVLVHGYGGDKDSWLFLQPDLGSDRLVHALDLPGHGASSKDVGNGSVDELAGALLGFLDEVGAARAHLVGHSLGGAVAATAAVSAPERVASLTLLAPVGLGEAIDADYLRSFATASSKREVKPLLGRLLADPSAVTRSMVDDVVRFKRLDGVQAALQRLCEAMLDGDRQAVALPDSLAQLDVPVTVVWGAQDTIVPNPGDDVLHARLPRARIELLDGAGHMPHMEKAGSVLASLRG
ncbi:MAG: acetoin dehydrogenase dihydrolipoyllysine-residue acetyltransferase subunit [Pseudonocardiaceae bacterium]|nr:acetoin dehydrogenase dihydrolipoyllysine-residue acetyltransferase subunit [Pseudonocardiaceae bacterium]